MRKIIRHFKHFPNILIFLALILVTWYIGQLVWPYKPLEFKDAEFPVLNEGKILRPGETLRYMVRFCKHTDKPAQVSYELQNDVIFYFSKTVDSHVLESCGEYENQIDIPDIKTTGKYRLVMVLKYQMSPIRTVEVRGVTEEFTIK